MSLLDFVGRVLPSPSEFVGRTDFELLEPVEERPTIGDALRTTGRICSLLFGLAGVAWVSGYPYLFPSLGPSAYALAVTPSAATSQPQRVIGAHLFGVLGGLVAYHSLASGLTVTHLPPAHSIASLRLAGSAILSLGLTSTAMLTTDLRHAPACATTLIIALGLMTTLFQAGVILTAVLILSILDYWLPSYAGIEEPPR